MGGLSLRRKKLKHISTEMSVAMRNVRALSLDLAFNQIVNFDKLCLVVGLVKLDMSHNGMVEISKHIGDLVNLEELNFSSNKIVTLPAAIGNLHKLKKLNISRNQITAICPQIGNLANLENFQAHYNKIPAIVAEMSNLKKLTDLNLGHNCISDCSGIRGLKLKKLILDYNKISALGSEFGELAAIDLSMTRNKISQIDDNIRNMQVESLHLTENKLTEISSAICSIKGLRNLSMSGNKITEVNPALLGSSITYLSLADNNITHLPLWMIDLKLEMFTYLANPIENILNPVIVRFLQRFDVHLHNFYSDKQNIHSTSIQASVRESVRNIMEQADPHLTYNFMADPILKPAVKYLLSKYCADPTVHSEIMCRFSDILQAVFKLMRDMPQETHILLRNRINQEIIDSYGMCFTGRISRLVNALSGISDRVSIQISPAEEIGNIISAVRLKYKDPAEIKFHAHKELTERKYSAEVIAEWIEHIE